MLVVFNKPFRVLSQFTDEDGRSTLADFIKIKNIYSIGRLDFDSEGLLLLTDNGKLKHKLANPKHKVDKVYLVQVEGMAKKSDIETLKKGIVLKDGPAKARHVKLLNEQPDFVWKRDPPIRFRKNDVTSWVEITINEGRNRQVRRMMANVGLPVLRLIRLSVGEYKLDKLAPGAHEVL